MSKGKWKWLSVFGLVWLLAGNIVWAKELESSVFKIKINERMVEQEEQLIQIKEDELQIIVWGEGERAFRFFLENEQGELQENEPEYQELSEEEFVLETGEIPKGDAVWKAFVTWKLFGNEQKLIIENGQQIREIFLDCKDEEIPEASLLYVYKGEERLTAKEDVYYCNEEATVTLEVIDNFSGLGKASIWLKSGDVVTERECVFWESDTYHTVLETTISQEGCWEVGIMAGDSAGNEMSEVLWLAAVNIEKEFPVLHVDINGSKGENDFFTGDVTLHLRAEDKKSGLKHVGIKLQGENVMEWETKGTKEEIEKEWIITADEYEDISYAEVWAEDFAGNCKTYEFQIKVDVTPPIAQLKFHPQNVMNGKFFSKERKATLRIYDQHFSDDKVFIQNGNVTLEVPKFRRVEDSGWYEADISFSKDGIYEIFIEYADLAGNRGEKIQAEPFVVDRTRPLVEVQYEDDNENGAFRKSRRARVLIEDANPDGEQISLHLYKDGKLLEEIFAEQLFNPVEDGLKGTVVFEKEGEYRWEIQVKDLAGNLSDIWESESFFIDLTEPELQLTGMKDGESINGDAEFSVEGKDMYLDRESMEVRIYRNGKQVLIKNKESEDEEEICISYESIPKERLWDGHYRIEASCMDIAGNQSVEKWEFTINRFGSSFSFENLPEAYYINETPKIQITERNPDEVVEQTLFAYGTEGIRLLKYGEDYSIIRGTDENGWNIYRYLIKEKSFISDGIYEISLHTIDKAGNVMDTRKCREIKLFLDRKGPQIQVGEFDAFRNEITVQVFENSPVKEVIFWVNGKQEACYDEMNFKEANGVFRLYPGNIEGKQQLVVEVADAAGNRITTEPLEFQKNVSLDSEEKEAMIQEETLEKKDHKIWLVLLFCIMTVIIVQFYKNKKEISGKSC